MPDFKSNEQRNADASAFPQTSVTHPNGDFIYGTPGLTKRELFAVMAMQGMLARRQAWDNTGIKDFAGEAVDYADALLAAPDVSTKP